MAGTTDGTIHTTIGIIHIVMVGVGRGRGIGDGIIHIIGDGDIRIRTIHIVRHIIDLHITAHHTQVRAV